MSSDELEVSREDLEREGYQFVDHRGGWMEIITPLGFRSGIFKETHVMEMARADYRQRLAAGGCEKGDWNEQRTESELGSSAESR